MSLNRTASRSSAHSPSRVLRKVSQQAGLPVVFNAWSQSSNIVDYALQLPDQERDAALLKWHTWKTAELQYVAFASALIAAVTSGSLTSSNPAIASAGILSCWYSGLLMAVIAITVAMQQFNTLSKMQCLVNGSAMLHLTLSTITSDGKGLAKESWLQHYIWQTPMMLMNFSIILYVFGLLQLVYMHPLPGLQDNKSASTTIKIVFTIAAIFSIGSYLIGWLGVAIKQRRVRRYLRSNIV